MYSLMHLFNKYLLSAFHILNTVPGSENTAQDSVPHLQGAYVLVRGTQRKRPHNEISGSVHCYHENRERRVQRVMADSPRRGSLSREKNDEKNQRLSHRFFFFYWKWAATFNYHHRLNTSKDCPHFTCKTSTTRYPNPHASSQVLSSR